MSIDLKAEGYPLVMLAVDLCRLMHWHPNTLYNRVKAGQAPAYTRVGSGKGARYEWLRPQVEAWLANQRRSLRRVG